MLDRFKRVQLTVAMAVIFAATFILAIPCLGEDWNSYTPSHGIGSGDDDWWMAYPDQHVSAGSDVEHPSWVLDALKEKPLLILVHSSNCVPCLTQIPRIEAVAASYDQDLKYYDVLAQEDSFEKAVAILDVYNPAGGAQYVPTTIFITLAEGPDGKVDVAWHSKIDVMSQDEIESYAKDSIYYYNQSREEWN